MNLSHIELSLVPREAYFPNVVQLDLSDNKIATFPKIINLMEKLQLVGFKHNKYPIPNLTIHPGHVRWITVDTPPGGPIEGITFG